jgi:hypothetical protein
MGTWTEDEDNDKEEGDDITGRGGELPELIAAIGF